MAGHLESGQAAERLARAYLQKHGLRWVASNYRCRFGELDLIMTEAATLVIVEVRYRRSDSFMTPSHSIDHGKIRRLSCTAEHFLQRNRRWRGRPLRFDVLGICGPLTRPDMKWIPGAFTIDDVSDRN